MVIVSPAEAAEVSDSDVRKSSQQLLIRTSESDGHLVWCPGEDSNLHGLRHWYLKPARLPIPPPGLAADRYEAPPCLSNKARNEPLYRVGAILYSAPTRHA